MEILKKLYFLYISDEFYKKNASQIGVWEADFVFPPFQIGVCEAGEIVLEAILQNFLYLLNN